VLDKGKTEKSGNGMLSGAPVEVQCPVDPLLHLMDNLPRTLQKILPGADRLLGLPDGVIPFG
jgi:hypothetical protein